MTTISTEDMLQLVSSNSQLLFHEENVKRKPYDVPAWMQYLEQVGDLLQEAIQKNDSAKSDAWIQLRDWTGRRAVGNLPRSYKLWKLHWEFCAKHRPDTMTELWEQALPTMSSFPRVWIECLEHAHTVSATTSSIGATKLRHLANQALEAIPATQHDKLWPVLLKYYRSTETTDIPKETKLSMLRRYIQFDPSATKEIADFLLDDLGHWQEAALLYVDLLNQPEISIVQRKDLWMDLANICTKHPVEEVGLDWDAMVRAVLTNNKKHSYLPEEMDGVLWSQLADSWIRRGQFQLARSAYEEALDSVSKVRDFTILLDAYLQLEEGLLEATMEAHGGAMEEQDESQANTADDWDILLAPAGEKNNTASMSDLELALARAEDLTARRPLLLNRVLLRQNPHDVGEWLKRARLFKEQEQIPQAAASLEEALKSVHARRAIGGSPSEIVSKLVLIYEVDSGDIEKARGLLDRICNQWEYEFSNYEDLAECYAQWIELELRHECWDHALETARRSVVVPPKAPKMTRGLSKSLRLWDLLLDLEESLGTMQTTKDAYNRAIEQQIATPMHILNFASFLSDQKYFEESFSAFERGVEIFTYPGVKVIWKTYIEAFLKRYEGKKVERTRDVFQRCLEACPSEDSVEFFLMWGKFEEEYGLTKRALTVYRDMCTKAPATEKYVAYQVLIAKTTKSVGQTATRDIYQSAIEDLDDTSAARLCLDFAKMETSLDEIDRARAVFTYGAQMADPRRNEQYWRAWNEFEVAYGNEETFREMLRIKRSTEASFSTMNYNAAEMGSTSQKTDTLSNEEAMKMIAEREGMELDENHASSGGFVGATKRKAQDPSLEDVEQRVAKLRKATFAGTQAENKVEADDDDEIDIDDLDEDDPDPKPAPAVVGVTTKAIPAEVFGGLANAGKE